jgi:transcriptional regulator with XRE-family HTH domain
MTVLSKASVALKELRKRAGYTVRGIEAMTGINYSTYATYENNYKKPHLPIELVEKLWPIFEGRGHPPIGPEDYSRLLGLSLDSLSDRVAHDDAKPVARGSDRATEDADGGPQPQVGEVIENPGEVALIRFWRRMDRDRREMVAILLGSVGFERKRNQDPHG